MNALGDAVGRLKTYIIDPIILVLLAAGLCLFMFGLVEFLWGMSKGGSPDKGKSHMLYGIIGMFIMFSVWGILTIINDTLGLDFGNPDVSRINAVSPGVNFGGY